MNIFKINFLLSIRNNLVIAIAYLLFIPFLRGIANLDAVRSAECLEQSVILIGVFLIVPLNAPEKSKTIQEVICSRKIPYWYILLLRSIMAILLVIMMISIFSGIMIWKNCIFPLMPYVAGTVISAIALGSLGFTVSVLSGSVIAGYLISLGYFLLNFLGNLSNENIFYLFSMGIGNYTSKIWLLGLSIVIITISLAYERKKKCS